MMFRSIPFSVATLATISLVGSSHASESGKRIEIAGPVTADVIRVIDGDTILVAAKPWPQQTMEVYVRLRGIDAPELKSACAATRDAGRQARSALASLTSEQGEIQLTHISGDKYFGRVVADVSLSDGRNPAQEMLLAVMSRLMMADENQRPVRRFGESAGLSTSPQRGEVPNGCEAMGGTAHYERLVPHPASRHLLPMGRRGNMLTFQRSISCFDGW